MDALGVVAVVLFGVVFPVVTVLALVDIALSRARTNFANENTAMINRGEPREVWEAHWANPPRLVRISRRLDTLLHRGRG